MKHAVAKIALLTSLATGCIGAFPEPLPQSGEPSFRSDASPSPPRDEIDAGLPGPQTFPRRPERPNPIGCRHEWPPACAIDCDNEPPPNQLLWVPANENIALPEGAYDYACVLVEGDLSVRGFTQLTAGRFVLGAFGTIDGKGQGASGPGDGGNGGSAYGRGSGGGGASGICRGGDSAALDQGETPAASAGATVRDMDQPGGRGGRGGDLERDGGPGGDGGASLAIVAGACVLAGTIDVSGDRGQDGGQGGDGGGGGGGAGGNIDLVCTDAEFNLSTLTFFANGGRGGNGGTASDRDGFYYGGGGGGGAAGVVRLNIDLGSTVRNGRDEPIADLPRFLADMRRRLSVLGGRGGSGGDAQNLAERGQNGADCRINVSVTELARDD